MKSKTEIMEAQVTVHGRVQGVAFRMFLREKAPLCGVSGWVRNTPLGTVEALFQGSREAVEKMLAFARQGPTLARVTRVETTWQETQTPNSQFEIRY